MNEFKPIRFLLSHRACRDCLLRRPPEPGHPEWLAWCMAFELDPEKEALTEHGAMFTEAARGFKSMCGQEARWFIPKGESDHPALIELFKKRHPGASLEGQ